jgi:signal peptidase I
MAQIAPAETETTDDTPSSAGQITSFLGAAAAGIFNWVIVPAGIVLILHFFVFQAFHVVGYSMVPTLDQADYLIIDKLDASLTRAAKIIGQSGNYYPKRGEIIVFHYPKDPSLVFVKRTIALPGDHVLVKNGKVTIINKDHPQGYNPDTTHLIADPVTLGDVDETVPQGNVFVLGDNRTPNGSFDSRDWGDLPANMIIGKAVLRLLPLNRFHVMGTGS